MKTPNRVLCVLLTVLTFTSVILFSAKTAENAQPPVQLEIAMDKSRYFVTNSVKLSVTVRNVGESALHDLTVCIFSDKHQLLFGNPSVFEAGMLDGSKSITFYSEMALNRNAAGLGLFDRIILFFTQLHRNYIPFAKAPDDGRDSVCESVRFRHGSTIATLQATVWYTVRAESSEETSTLQDVVPETSEVEVVTSEPRPQATLLRKYVTDILKSGVYTTEMEMKEDGMTIPFTVYEDGNNTAVETSLTQYVMQNVSEVPQALANLGKVRFIIKDKKSSNAKVYIAWTGGYYEPDNADEVSGMLQDLQDENGFDLLQHADDEGLEYCGTSSGTGYVCETYKDSDKNMQYNFYFAKMSGYEGIISMDVVNLSTGATEQHIVMRVYPGVTNSNAFAVSGKKYTDADIEKMFGE